MANKATRRKTNNNHTFFFAVCAAVVLILISFPLINKYQDKQEKDKLEKTSEIIDYNVLPRLGEPDAPIKVVLFEDFKCTACKFWEEEHYANFKSDFIDTGKAQLYFVNFAFIGEDSTTAALAGKALYKQSNSYFWKYYQLMYQNQGEESEIWATEDFIANLVKKEIPGADVDALLKDMRAKEATDGLDRDMGIVKALGIGFTPSVLVDKVLIQDGNDYEKVKNTIEAALDQKEVDK